MKKVDEPIGGILDRAPKVRASFGSVGGFLLMLCAIIMSRRTRFLTFSAVPVGYFLVRQFF
jgi:hypothetical protein